ncbi:hypothetical protein WOLCODRAFT_95626 [Wolfiporia cocos MD-104 SS10]|uniref:CCHC-type domain-containing protein n=1 Tax=Wolfiporia cocos (strain MD-104) TaxID=742152 RepID=A0A2H3JIV8_WOLCO|nr:hypothetical protein WOLCODRAFT_95626 [Wolfiporia cocos MD-104 SS10]
MASRGVGRMARLTLFSGPNCSLCDIAKAELVKVRQQRSFDLETINIQDAGQERWKRKYVYWIPALHVEGREVAKGRWNAETVNSALDLWEKDPWTKDEPSAGAGKPHSQQQQQQMVPLYVEDLHRNGNTQDEDCGSGYYLYERCGETALGLSQDEDIGHIDERRCFNCGLPGHMISSCPEPRNHALITLSRQLFNFFKGDNASNGNQRVHEVERWRQQRLEWLETFEPGQIRGSLLRDALDLKDGDAGENVEWLRNMCIWGYPKGWYASVDPRERIWNVLSGGDDGDDSSEYAIDDFMFDIVGEDSVERLVLPSKVKPHARDTESNASDSDSESDPELSSASSRSSTPSSRAQPAPQRWAAYPLTYFLWSRLPIYNGLSLPSPQSIRNAPRQSSVYEYPPPPCTTPPPLPSAEAPVARYESQYPVEQYPPPPPPTVPPPLPPMMPPPAMLLPFPAAAPPTHHTALLSIPHSAPI